MIELIYLGSISALTGVMGLAILYRRISLLTRGAQARGDFVRWESRGIRTTYFHPVVTFIAHDGKRYEFVGGPGSTGQKKLEYYRVIYPFRNPEKAMVFSFWAFWAAPPAFLILSAGAAIAAFQQYSP